MANFSDRQAQLGNLRDDLKKIQNDLENILNSLGWEYNYLEQNDSEVAVCPLNSQHILSNKTLQMHIDHCSWNMQGYHSEDVALPDSCGPYFGPSSTITFDKEKIVEVLRAAASSNPSMKTGNTLQSDEMEIPRTSNRLTSYFTQDERLALYDYVISNTSRADDSIPHDLQMIFPEQGTKSLSKSEIEILMEQRDAKRRRISYKTKVHLNKKSHTEILREVIKNQMDFLLELQNTDVKGKGEVSPESKDISDGTAIYRNDKSREKVVLDDKMPRNMPVFVKSSIHKTSRTHEKSSGSRDNYSSYIRPGEYSLKSEGKDVRLLEQCAKHSGSERFEKRRSDFYSSQNKYNTELSYQIHWNKETRHREKVNPDYGSKHKKLKRKDRPRESESSVTSSENSEYEYSFSTNSHREKKRKHKSHKRKHKKSRRRSVGTSDSDVNNDKQKSKKRFVSEVKLESSDFRSKCKSTQSEGLQGNNLHSSEEYSC